MSGICKGSTAAKPSSFSGTLASRDAPRSLRSLRTPTNRAKASRSSGVTRTSGLLDAAEGLLVESRNVREGLTGLSGYALSSDDLSSRFILFVAFIHARTAAGPHLRGVIRP